VETGAADVIAHDGERWTLDLFQHTEYEAEQQIDPQTANTVDEAKRSLRHRCLGRRAGGGAFPGKSWYPPAPRPAYRADIYPQRMKEWR
jgi:hypothetical protein